LTDFVMQIFLVLVEHIGGLPEKEGNPSVCQRLVCKWCCWKRNKWMSISF